MAERSQEAVQRGDNCVVQMGQSRQTEGGIASMAEKHVQSTECM